MATKQKTSWCQEQVSGTTVDHYSQFKKTTKFEEAINMEVPEIRDPKLRQWVEENFLQDIASNLCESGFVTLEVVKTLQEE